MRTPTAAALTLRLAIRDQTSDARGILRRGHARRMPMQAIIIRALIGEVRVRSASRAPQARAACRRGGPVGQHILESRLRWRLGVALGFVWCGAMGDLRARCGSERLRAYSRRRCHAQVRCRRLLGLERLERAQRAPELGHGRAAIARKVSNERAPLPSRIKASPRPPLATRRSSNSSASIRSARARRNAATATRRASTACSAPTGASSSISAASSASNSAASSSGSRTCFCARMPCLRAFCADLRPAFCGLRPARTSGALFGGLLRRAHWARRRPRAARAIHLEALARIPWLEEVGARPPGLVAARNTSLAES